VRLRGSALLLVLVLAGAAWLLQCTGPWPEIQSVAVREPPLAGLPYEIDVQVRNKWRGHGELQVYAELHDAASGRGYQGKQNATIEPREIINVVVEIQAAPGNYEPRVKVEYPPR
jgi:hypothetical protein